MYLHPRLLVLAEGVRWRILFAAMVGMLTVAAGVARLACRGICSQLVATRLVRPAAGGEHNGHYGEHNGDIIGTTTNVMETNGLVRCWT